MSQGRNIIGTAAALALCALAPAHGQDGGAPAYPFSLPGAYHEIETKYLFGFTDGSDIGAEGEAAVESETNVALRRRHGTYAGVEQEIEFEGVPTQYFAYELSLHGVGHSIRGDDVFDDRHRVAFGGFSTNLRYLLLARGPESPLGLTLTAEPEWARVDGDSGAHMQSFGSTFKILADTELVENRLFLAGNLQWAPGYQRAALDPTWTRAATLGATGAFAWRVSPTVALGGGVQYYRAHDSLTFQRFQGGALYIGPTLHVQLTKKIMLAGAFSAQVAGHAVGDPLRLDLADFSRYRARLKLEMEF